METAKRGRAEYEGDPDGPNEVHRGTKVILFPDVAAPFPQMLISNSTVFKSNTVDLSEFMVTPESWALIVAYRWALLQSSGSVTVEKQLPSMRQKVVECGPALMAHNYLYPGELDLPSDHDEEGCLCTGVFVMNPDSKKPIQLTRENAPLLFQINCGAPIKVSIMRGNYDPTREGQEEVLEERLYADSSEKKITGAALLRLILSGKLFEPGTYKGEQVMFQDPEADESVWLSVNVIGEPFPEPPDYPTKYEFMSDRTLFKYLDMV